MHNDCIPCFQKQAERLIIKHELSEKSANEVKVKLNTFINKKNGYVTSPEVGRYLNELVKAASGTNDLYAREKREYNDMVLNMYDDLKLKVQSSDYPEYPALRYALAGNIIDFGPPSEFDAAAAFSNAIQKIPSINHANKLISDIKLAETVLYLGDNAGEIVADKLFIETLHHPNLFFAVRGGFVMNDVTMEDAYYVGMDKTAKLLSNGYDAPSTILSECSQEFMQVYEKADVVISKGQGNLEGLIDEKGKKIYFLLMVKCDVMASRVGVNVGDVVVWNNQ